MEWKKHRLRDLALSIQTGPFGSQLHQADYSDSGIPVIMPKDMINGKVETNDIARVSDIHVQRLKRHKVKSGDIIYSRRGDVGRCSLITEREEGWLCGTGCLKVALDKSKCVPSFIAFILQRKDSIGWVENHAVGATMPNLNTGILSNLPLIIPTFEEQVRIASILSAYDNLIENNNKRIRLLEQMAENLYKEWFVRFRFPGHENAEFENGLPKGWVYAKLEDILSLKDSVRIPLSSLERSNMQKKYPYYGAASILDYVDDYLFDGVYLLLGEDGSVIDENGYPYIQYVWGRFWVNNHAHVIEKKGVYSVEFLYCLFKRMNIQSVVTGVAQPKISQGRLFNKKVIKPCDSIISLFDKQIQPIFAGIRQLTEENNNLSRQRDLLLPRLMSGKLEVNV